MRGLALALLILTAGCVIPNMRPDIRSAEDIGPDDCVVIGRLVMDPPLSAAEKNMNDSGATFTVGTGRIEKNLWILMGPGPWAKDDEPETSDFEGAIETGWNQLFYSAFTRELEVMQMAVVYMTLSQKAYFPLNLKIDIKRSDKAIYIGTIKITRDDFNRPKKLEVLDDWDKDAAKAQKKLGNKVTIRKALAFRVKTKEE